MALERVGRQVVLLTQIIGHILGGGVDRGVTLTQMVNLGFNSIPIVLIVAGFAGMVFALHTTREFARFGATALAGQVLGIAMVRELSPVLTGIVMAARGGSAIAAEVGAMQVTEQVDAMRALAVDPVEYLVVPRFVACTLMTPLLTIFANVLGLLGGCFVAACQVGVSGRAFLESVNYFLSVGDLVAGILKALIFGGIVALIGCSRGFMTEGGAAGVGESTTGSVVSAIITIFAVNYFLSTVIFHDSVVAW